MPCFVDEERFKSIYSDCVLDFKKPEDCTFAEELKAEGKSKHSCQYWRKDEVVEVLRCKCCGQVLPSNAEITGG